MTTNNHSKIATLWRYPVKSMMGEEINASAVTAQGLLGDRAYALVDKETGKVVSAKNPQKWPDFFFYRAAYINPPDNNGIPPVWITLPNGEVIRSDALEISQRLSQSLGREVTFQSRAPEKPALEQFWPEFEGQSNAVTSEAVAGDAPTGTFFDYAMLHILTTSALEQLRQYYPAGRSEVRRFRPNMVIDTSGLQGIVENTWIGKTLCIGDQVKVMITDPCPRCVMTTLAQGDLPKDPGIFRHGIMRNNVHVPFAGKALPSFGVYAKVISPGLVRRGDTIVIQ